MKNKAFQTCLLFCFFMLLINTPSQAIIATTVAVSKVQKKTSKQDAKIERLKKKLSRKIAKMQQKKMRTEGANIKRDANWGLRFGILPVLLAPVQYYLTLVELPVFWVFIGVSLLLILLSFIFSKKALKKIKNSDHPEQYQNDKNKANIAVGLSVVTLMATLLLTAAWVYFIHFFF